MDYVAAKLAKLWNFEPTEELPRGFCSHVYATPDKVLKVPFQGEEMTSGYFAMIRQTGPFAPKIFAHDSATGSMLMERAIPGTKLHESGIDEPEQLSIWMQIALAFREMDTDNLRPMNVYSSGKDPLAKYLLASTTREVAIHGDLHHENILKHRDGWMCIDAKGLVGDPAIEGAAFILNPWPQYDDFPAAKLRQNIQNVADALDVESFRVWAWTLCRKRERQIAPDELGYKSLSALWQIAPEFDAEKWI